MSLAFFILKRLRARSTQRFIREFGHSVGVVSFLFKSYIYTFQKSLLPLWGRLSRWLRGGYLALCAVLKISTMYGLHAYYIRRREYIHIRRVILHPYKRSCLYRLTRRRVYVLYKEETSLFVETKLVAGPIDCLDRFMATLRRSPL